ncbi:MFS family permease [Providencia alcalifaciens]|nr:MFS family permease [Providencia alcalifaciens]
MTFIIGPPVSVGLAVALFPQAGLIIAMFLLIVGVASLILQRKTEPVLSVSHAVICKPRWIMSQTGMQLLVLLMIAMGAIVGTVDISSVALAEYVKQPAAASLVLSAYALGSCLMGLVYGALTLKTSLPRLLLLGGILTALSVLPLYFVSDVVSLAIVVFIAGLFFAPTMIVAMSLVENLVSENQLTEGMTWLLAGLNIGVAMGAALSGKLVDSYSVQAGFLVAIMGGVIVLLAATLGQRRHLLSNNSIDQATIE